MGGRVKVDLMVCIPGSASFMAMCQVYGNRCRTAAELRGCDECEGACWRWMPDSWTVYSVLRLRSCARE